MSQVRTMVGVLAFTVILLVVEFYVYIWASDRMDDQRLSHQKQIMRGLKNRLTDKAVQSKRLTESQQYMRGWLVRYLSTLAMNLTVLGFIMCFYLASDLPELAAWVMSVFALPGTLWSTVQLVRWGFAYVEFRTVLRYKPDPRPPKNRRR